MLGNVTRLSWSDDNRKYYGTKGYSCARNGEYFWAITEDVRFRDPVIAICDECKQFRQVKKENYRRICNECQFKKNFSIDIKEKQTLKELSSAYFSVREVIKDSGEFGISLNEIQQKTALNQELIISSIETLKILNWVTQHSKHQYYFWNDESKKNTPLLTLILKKMEKEYKS